MISLRTFAIMLCLNLLLSTQATPDLNANPIAKSADRPMRGVWLASVGSKAMMDHKGIIETVQICKRAGINTIFVVTWNRGVTLYPSEVMQQEFGVAIDPRLKGRDPLKELIEVAHAEDIEVHAWFEFGFSSSYRKPDGGAILNKRPQWSALQSHGKLVSRNGFQWMNGFDPEVQDFMVSMLKEVVSNYDVDGVQGDDRLPALPNTAGYDPLTIKMYQAEHGGQSPPEDHLDADWIQWRADKLSLFVKRTYEELKAIDPDLCVSWAPNVWPWSRDQYLQDWPRWAQEGWGDLFLPQVYRKDLKAYRDTLQMTADQFPKELLPKIVPGVLIALADGYDLPSSQIREMVEINRDLGFEGEVYFYFDGLKQHAEIFETLYHDSAAE